MSQNNSSSIIHLTFFYYFTYYAKMRLLPYSNIHR